MIADPKAVQYVFHKPGYIYDKTTPRAHFNELVVGKGLVSVRGLSSLQRLVACRSSTTKLKCRRSTPSSTEGHKPGIQCTSDAVVPSFVPAEGVKG
jgi:hypothetical protein